jgi:hypothetical protein
MRPSIALRCPVSSANSSNNTSNRATRGGLGTKDGAAEDMTPSSQRGTTLMM